MEEKAKITICANGCKNMTTGATALHPFFGYFCPVRIASFLLSLYLCVMVIYPCNDQGDCADEAQTSLSLSYNGTQDHSGQDEDLCSPLCICSCCAAAYQLSYSLEIALSAPFHRSADPTLYAESLLLDNRTPIWQPPKISCLVA